MILGMLEKICRSEGCALREGEDAVKGSFGLDVRVQLAQSVVHARGGRNVVVLVVCVCGREVGFDFGRDGAGEGALGVVECVMVVHFITDRCWRRRWSVFGLIMVGLGWGKGITSLFVSRGLGCWCRYRGGIGNASLTACLT